LFAISDPTKELNPDPLFSCESSFVNDEQTGITGKIYNGDIAITVGNWYGPRNFTVPRTHNTRYGAGIRNNLSVWQYNYDGTIGRTSGGKNFFYFIHGMYGEIGYLDFDDDSSYVNVEGVDSGNDPYLTFTSSIENKFVKSSMIVPFCSATMYAKMKTVNFANPVLIDDFFDYANVNISRVIDEEIINLGKYVYSFEGLGDWTHGLGNRPSPAVFELKAAYIQ
jgi:hypothetical protein